MHSDPMFNALFAAVLGVLAALYFGPDRPWEYKGIVAILGIACGLLGFLYGEPVVSLLVKTLGFGAPRA